MSTGPEWELVEQPLLEQLASLGWETLIWGRHDQPQDCGRESEREVLLEQRLRAALNQINPDYDAKPWLDDDRLDAAIAELRSMPAGIKLLEANQKSTKLLINGTTVPGLEGWDGGRDRTINYIDWGNWEANDFLAVSQFRVATPGPAKDIQPDLTLFVNGIPLVVIEAKAPGKESAITVAIDQLRRYANQRDNTISEGSEQLFWTNQFTVATCGERAEAATFSALPEDYMAWKDPHPSTVEELATSLSKPTEEVTQQEVLTDGMLAPELLLDIVRHFTLFKESGPTTVKVVARYQQYRGVHKAIDRLLTGDTKGVDGGVDRRGGIVWHTQGSGKSLTMVFLIRAMRSHPKLRQFKIVLITDRTDLQRQLGDTAALTGETVQVARSSHEVKQLLSQPGPGVVMAMIQKYRDTSSRTTHDSDDGLEGGKSFETLNESDSILVMVDEAHRSHSVTPRTGKTPLHITLMKALPNAARIGFTGTPIIMGNRKKTLEIFGDYLDQYTLAESEADGSTVPIFYEGHTTDAAVRGASKMDDIFFRWFDELTDEQREVLQKKYVTTAQVLEAPEMIAAKARSMLRHYVGTVMPQRFKGLIVATSRQACVRYYDALNEAKDELVTSIGERGDSLTERSSGGALLHPDDQFIVDAGKHFDLIQALDFAPIFSGDHNDPPNYLRWTAKTEQAERIKRFKRPLGTQENVDESDPLAILIVKSMLLTGFDAPNAQVLYLDRLIQEAELLQAIARVNRTAANKTYGLVVDYYGVSSQLTTALAAYTNAHGDTDPDADGALRPLTSEIEKLEPQSERVLQVFVQRGVEPKSTNDSIELCVQLLEDERLRAEFDVALKTFLQTFDIVLPRPDAFPFVAKVNLYVEIQFRTRQRYRDNANGDFDPFKYKEKVRALVDQHTTVLDLSQKIQSIRITDPRFSAHVQSLATDRAKASEMEHAVRHHIRENADEDPAHFARLSERVDEILERLEGHWDQITLELQPIIDGARTGRQDDNETGLDPVTELPFHGILADKVANSEADVSGRVIDTTHQLVAEVKTRIAVVGFWDNATKQDELRKIIKRHLDQSDLFAYNDLDEVAVQLVDLARANRNRLA